jgi:hypothetical protein
VCAVASFAATVCIPVVDVGTVNVVLKDPTVLVVVVGIV